MSKRKFVLFTLLNRYAILAFGAVTRALPLPVARSATIALGRIAYYAVPRIRKVGLANLDTAYGDTLSPAEKRRILRASVDNIALVAAEFSRVPMIAACGGKGYVRIEGVEHLDRAKGVFAIGMHFGNWEWMPPALAGHGFNVAEVVRPFDDPKLDALIDGTRRCGGVRTLPKDEAAKDMVSLLQEGWLVGVLIDQNPREHAVPGTFFGKPCWHTIAPALIAARSGAAVHPSVMFRQEDGAYVIRFYPAVELVSTGNARDDIQANAQRCQDSLEAIIREKPGHWLWFHRRWKARPRLQAEWDARQRAK